MSFFIRNINLTKLSYAIICLFTIILFDCSYIDKSTKGFIIIINMCIMAAIIGFKISKNE